MELLAIGGDVSFELTSMFLNRNKPGASCFRGCLGTAGRRTPIVRLGTRVPSSPTGEHKLPIVENTTRCKGPLDTESTPLGKSKNICFGSKNICLLIIENKSKTMSKVIFYVEIN